MRETHRPRRPCWSRTPTPSRRSFLAANLAADGHRAATAASLIHARHQLADGRARRCSCSARWSRPATRSRCWARCAPRARRRRSTRRWRCCASGPGGDELAELRALRAGADDWAPLPLRYPVLLERVRRAAAPHAAGGRAAADRRARARPGRAQRARRRRRAVELTNHEFALLARLASEPTRVWHKRELLADAVGLPGRRAHAHAGLARLPAAREARGGGRRALRGQRVGGRLPAAGAGRRARAQRDGGMRRGRLKRSAPLERGAPPERRTPLARTTPLRPGPVRAPGRQEGGGVERRAPAPVGLGRAAREDRRLGVRGVRGRRRASRPRTWRRGRWAAVTSRSAWCRCAGCTTGRMTPGGWSCCRTSSREWRDEVAHAVLHLGLIGAVRRLAPGRR